MNWSYHLSIPPSAVGERLTRAIDRPGLRYWLVPGTTSGAPLIGEVSDNRFWLRLRHRGKATGAPWLTGQIIRDGGGSTVAVEMHSPLTKMVLAVAAVAAVALAALLLDMQSRRGAPDLAIGLAVILVALALPLSLPILYGGERRALRSNLDDLFADALDPKS